MAALLEADDLDNLIADSLGGVQSALDGDRRAASPSGGMSADAGAGGRSAADAVRELRDGGGDDLANEELFSCLVKTLQDENFQKTMSEALQGIDSSATAAEGVELPATANGHGLEDFLQGFSKSFEGAAASDSKFDKEITSLMTSMLPTDLICEPLQQIADRLEPWLKSQKGLAEKEKTRFESQLKLYRKIVSTYKDSPDPLPEATQAEVQQLMAELHLLGQPPDEVMKEISPKEAEDGGETFEDFMKTMGLDQGLGTSEQDLLKKLSEDPEALTTAMKELSAGLPEDGCKQQ